MQETNASALKKVSPKQAFIGQRLLYSRYEICGVLGIGLTTTDELLTEGVIDEVRIGRRRMATAESVHRLAKAR